MSDYYISQIRPDDKPANRQLDLLLSSEGIRRTPTWITPAACLMRK